MKFTKYQTHGAYHWKWYKKSKRYIEHVNFLKEWVKEKNTLDVGAGDGLITYVLGIKGIDNEPKGVELAQEKGANVIFGDAYNIPYKNGEFDSVLMSDTLEHFEFPEKALQEAKRVLTKYLYLVVPIIKKDIEPFHYNHWNSAELIKFVESQKLQLVEKPIFIYRKVYCKLKKCE